MLVAHLDGALFICMHILFHMQGCIYNVGVTTEVIFLWKRQPKYFFSYYSSRVWYLTRVSAQFVQTYLHRMKCLAVFCITSLNLLVELLNILHTTQFGFTYSFIKKTITKYFIMSQPEAKERKRKLLTGKGGYSESVGIRS